MAAGAKHPEGQSPRYAYDKLKELVDGAARHYAGMPPAELLAMYGSLARFAHDVPPDPLALMDTVFATVAQVRGRAARARWRPYMGTGGLLRWPPAEQRRRMHA